MIDNEKIAIVGTLPPPLGGVSTSLERMLSYLDKARVDYVLYNTGLNHYNHPKVRNIGKSIFSLFWIMFFSRHRLIHFHTSKWLVRFYAVMISFITKAKIIFTAHGFSIIDSLESPNPIIKLLSKISCKKASIIIATNNIIKKSLLSHGIKQNRLCVYPAFVPPQGNVNIRISSEVENFCINKKPIIASNGSYTTINDKDVYGLETQLELIKLLRKDFPNIGLVIYIRKDNNIGNKLSLKLKKLLLQYNLQNNVLFHESNDEFWPFLKICDLFLRPTSTDGDANSIREALYFNKNVIASNSVIRTSGCNLYIYNDMFSLEQCTRNVLTNKTSNNTSYEKCNCATYLIELYKKIVNKE